MILVTLQGTSFNITVIQVYAPTTSAEEAEVDQFYENLEDLLEVTHTHTHKKKKKKKKKSFSSKGIGMQK